MDNRKFASGASATPPSAPVSPSVGYPRSGDPGSGTPATKPGDYWYHQVGEEMRAVIVAAGLTPSSADLSQLLQAIQSIGGALAKVHGQCRLAKAGANIALTPFNGNKLLINGVAQQVPAAGVTLPATGLVAGTLYYIYAYMSSGVMTLEASTTGHSTDSTTGVEIKTGDATRTLVGMVRPVTGPAFVDTESQRFVASWFNRQKLQTRGVFTVSRSTTSASLIEINSEIRNEFLIWSGQVMDVSFQGGMANSGTVNANYASLGFDGATPENIVIGSGNLYEPMSVRSTKSNLSEGYHYVTALGACSTGTVSFGDGTRNASINGLVSG